MNSLEDFILNDVEIKRLKELHQYFLKDDVLNKKMSDLFILQKKMVQLKVDNNITDYNKLKNSYDALKDEIIDLPFVEEYFELLDNFKFVLKIVSDSITNMFDKDFKFDL